MPVGLALDRRIDGAIRLHVLVVGEAPGAHIAELPSGGIGRGGKSKHVLSVRTRCKA